MDKVRRAGILGTGRYVPEKVVTNEDLSALMDTLCFPMNPVRLHTLLVLKGTKRGKKRHRRWLIS